MTSSNRTYDAAASEKYCFMDQGPPHKSFPVALGCGKYGTLLINIKHVALQFLSTQSNLRFESGEFNQVCDENDVVLL